MSLVRTQKMSLWKLSLSIVTRAVCLKIVVTDTPSIRKAFNSLSMHVNIDVVMHRKLDELAL